MRSFLEYVKLQESEENPKKGINAEVKLSDDSDYKPFIVDAENHPNLKPIVQAFLAGNQVSLPGPDGYPQKLTTLDAKGESTPKLKKKQLYLVGGAVRDHLAGKTPKNYELATNATPDEIRLILRAAGFNETKPKESGGDPKQYEKLRDSGAKNKIFYAKGWDRAGKEFTIGVRVNNEEFEIATFRKGNKGGKKPDKAEFTPSFDEDTIGRDFTINSMAIPLTSDNGPNSKLLDPHGGAHHLKNGDINFIGDEKASVADDQMRAMRYIRMACRFGKKNEANVPDKIKKAIEEIKDLPSVNRKEIKAEFVDGLEHPDVDTKKYIKMYKDTGLLNTVFPGMIFKLDNNKDFTDKKEKRLVLAWILRKNDPDAIKEMLSYGDWDKHEINDIIHLIKMHGWASKFGKDDNGFFDDFYDVKNDFNKTNLVPSIIKQWGQMNDMHGDVIKNYLGHEMDTKAYVPDAFGLGRVINPEIIQHLSGKTPVGQEFGHAIRGIETDKFRKKF